MSADRPQCLLLVDLQRSFVSGAAAVPDHRGLLEAVQRQLTAARRAGALVVHVQNDGTAETMDEPDSPGWELFLPVDASDVVIRKTEDSAFVGTPLHELLQHNRVSAVSVCGVLSEMCVAATVRSALELDYDIVLAHDAHATYDVPAITPDADPVPAALAARAAEWSLGDGLAIPVRSTEVRFAAADRRQPPGS